MWIVTPGKEEKSNTYTYYKRAKEKLTSGGHYHRIRFFRFCSETNTDQENSIFCVIQSSTSNTVLFNRFINARDNGVFSIGSLIAVSNPDTIEDYMKGIPIIVSNGQSILTLPMNHSLIPMRNDLEANESKGFVIQHSRIQVRRILFLDTKCNGKFFDRQNVLIYSNKSCGCFSLKPSRSNIISMRSIFFPTDTGDSNMMRKFSSLKILEIFTKGNLSVDIRASRLQSDNDSHDKIVDAFDEIVDLVKYEGGRTVYGWGKRGLINDVSLLVNDIKKPGDNKFLSQEISAHVVHLHPPEKDYLDFH